MRRQDEPVHYGEWRDGRRIVTTTDPSGYRVQWIEMKREVDDPSATHPEPPAAA